MFCIHCGKKIDINSKFCCYCGKEQKIIYSEYYVPRNYILTKNELKFYKILINIAKELNLILLCQVSLYSILRPIKKNSKFFNKIRSKSIDFVLIEENSSKIVLCIELDDKTHNYKSRISRDNFINELFKDLNIKLLRIKSNKLYDKLQIKNIIVSNIN